MGDDYKDVDQGPPDQHFEVWGTCVGLRSLPEKGDWEARREELVAPIFLNNRTWNVPAVRSLQSCRPSDVLCWKSPVYRARGDRTHPTKTSVPLGHAHTSPKLRFRFFHAVLLGQVRQLAHDLMEDKRLPACQLSPGERQRSSWSHRSRACPRAWDEEVARRVAEIKAGTAQTSPLDDLASRTCARLWIGQQSTG